MFFETDKVAGESLIGEENSFEFVIYPGELVENVFRPIFAKVVNYLENILLGVGSSVEAIILVGDLFYSVYVTEMIEEICERVDIKCINPVQCKKEQLANFDAALEGAVFKSVDTMKEYNQIPRIVLDKRTDLTRSTGDDLHEAFVFIGAQCSIRYRFNKCM